MKLNILLLCNKPKSGQDANTIVDHIDALENYSGHKVYLCSNFGDLPPNLKLNKFDVIIIHYSLCLLNDYYISKQSKLKLRNYPGLKVVFIQDEYRQINKMVNELIFLNIDVLFTCFPEHEINKIYTKDKLPNVSKYNNLTGYIPQRLTEISQQPLIKERTIHVGYRGRKVPFWLGELAYEKWSIVEKWQRYANRSDLNIDLSYNEKDRIYGKNWVDFLSSCKTTLGVESGASVMDFTSQLEKAIDFHQATHPNDSFQVVQNKYLVEHEGKYKLNQISPRCFEAIALKTVLVLYEGEYSGILTPGRHYIELKKDFSNIESVLNCIRNDVFLQNMADIAFHEVALNPKYSYQAFVDYVDKILLSEFISRAKKEVNIGYSLGEFQCDIKYIPLKNRFYKNRLAIYQKLPENLRLVVKGIFRPKLVIRHITKNFFRLLYPVRDEKKKFDEHQ